MYGDFSRLLSTRNISRVQFNQGRPLIDADMNEAISTVVDSHIDLLSSLDEDLPRRGSCSPGNTINAPYHKYEPNDVVGLIFNKQPQLSHFYTVQSASTSGDQEANSFTIELPSGQNLEVGDVLVIPLGHFAIGNAFRPSEIKKELYFDAGAFVLGGRVIVNRNLTAAQYRKMSDDSMVLDFDEPGTEPPSAEADATKPNEGIFLIGLAALERPVFLHDLTKQKRTISADVRSANYYTLQYRVFLKPVAQADKILSTRETVLRKNRLGEPPHASFTIPGHLHGKLVRAEVHEIDGEKCTYKLSVDNGARCFEATYQSRRLKVTPPTMASLAAPKPGDFIELEARRSVHWIDDKPNPMHRLKERDELDTSVDVQLDEGDQIRCWDDSLVVEKNKLTDEVVFPNTQIRFRLTGNHAWLRRGDYWIASIRDTRTDSVEAEGARPFFAVATLGTVTFDDGDPTFNDHRRRVSFASNARGSFAVAKSAPATVTPFPVASHPRAVLLAKTPDSPQVDWAAIPCHKHFESAQSPVVRRWLASMTFGELGYLSPEQIRQRIVKDCGLNEKESLALIEDIERVVAKRNQLQQLSSAYA